MTVEEQIKELEAKVARKKALVNAKISFPKDTPKTLVEELTRITREELTKLANEESGEATSGFTAEEVRILKLLAGRASGKTQNVVTKPAPTPSSATPAKKSETVAEKVVTEKSSGIVVNNLVGGEYQGKIAEIISLDAVPVRQRGKVGSMERCMVMEEREDGLLNVKTLGGVRLNIAPEYLNFDLVSE
jgi:hypothetical protein